ncbi:MAG: 16S rRNA (uracil(1498)-N(3))-methyltransferase [Flavobacteriales bacterium]|nr:16S rRNA (uracil(1498)-N(3))-methyltransferase [Flavobacteriales bacterium]
MQLFYTPDINPDEYTLSKEESRHCIQVLRKKIGDIIYLVDGKGGYYKATLIGDNPKSCHIKIDNVERNYGKSDLHIHIAIAPTKMNERFEWFLEKSTEIGINEITPIICEHSERKVLKLERMNKILIAAMKQSKQAYLPKLNAAVSFDSFVSNNTIEERYIANCAENDKKKQLKEVIKKGTDTLVLIGPEGDFSQKEINYAMKHGFSSVSLSKNRLRTETAAIVSCNTINLINQ